MGDFERRVKQQMAGGCDVWQMRQPSARQMTPARTTANRHRASNNCGLQTFNVDKLVKKEKDAFTVSGAHPVSENDLFDTTHCYA